jgi:hypothetical protein
VPQGAAEGPAGGDEKRWPVFRGGMKPGCRGFGFNGLSWIRNVIDLIFLQLGKSKNRALRIFEFDRPIAAPGGGAGWRGDGKRPFGKFYRCLDCPPGSRSCFV